jgi:hypothetical protein
MISAFSGVSPLTSLFGNVHSNKMRFQWMESSLIPQCLALDWCHDCVGRWLFIRVPHSIVHLLKWNGSIRWSIGVRILSWSLVDYVIEEECLVYHDLTWAMNRIHIAYGITDCFWCMTFRKKCCELFLPFIPDLLTWLNTTSYNMILHFGI